MPSADRPACVSEKLVAVWAAGNKTDLQYRGPSLPTMIKWCDSNTNGVHTALDHGGNLSFLTLMWAAEFW